ncbi:MFS transporter [Amycolatopsis anabasis]|uniref:MFS transporter n=1 Tax=Amycolatopsis anabasis TaxID=1840409 RepID=UPI00131E6CF2|nr:MFS transporter [Amycolatopsis anabasis]
MPTIDTHAPPGENAAGPAENPHHARRWLILAVLGLAQLLVVLDASIVNVALPSAQADLGFSTDARQWIVTSYALAFGSLLPLGGRIADLFGRKTTFLIGLAGFAAASAVGGAAPGIGVLIAARTTQGVFGALLAPAALSLLTTTFTDPKERGKAFGIYGAIAGTGGAIGLLLGGTLTEYLGWRWCLYVCIVFAALACAGGAFLLRERRSGQRPKLDLPGTIAVSAGLFCLVYGFSNAQTDDWSAASVWGFLVAGAVLLAVFVVLQTRVAHPLLPMRVLLDRDRGGAYIAVFLTGAGMFGILLFLAYYLQQNLGFSPIRSGVAFLPMVGALMLTASLATNVLLPRFGPRYLVAAGMLIAAGGLCWLSALEADSGYAAGVLPGLTVSGLGIGLAMAPSMSVATQGVDPGDAGVASAAVNTAQQVGGSIGTAVLSTVAASAVTAQLTGKVPAPDVLAEASVHGYTTAFGWAAAIFAAGAVACGLVLRSSGAHYEEREGDR